MHHLHSVTTWLLLCPRMLVRHLLLRVVPFALHGLRTSEHIVFLAHVSAARAVTLPAVLQGLSSMKVSRIARHEARRLLLLLACECVLPHSLHISALALQLSAARAIMQRIVSVHEVGAMLLERY